MVGTANENRYFVATQDPELREKCRKVPGTPILYLHSSAPTLERPSEMSENQAQNTVEARMTGMFFMFLKYLKRASWGFHGGFLGGSMGGSWVIIPGDFLGDSWGILFALSQLWRVLTR